MFNFTIRPYSPLRLALYKPLTYLLTYLLITVRLHEVWHLDTIFEKMEVLKHQQKMESD